MYRIIEVVGVSPDGYSEAVRNAVERVTAGGDEAHYFTVGEQRGLVRDGRLAEFQVMVKVAIGKGK